MSMKKFLSRSRKSEGESCRENALDLQPAVSPPQSNTTIGSQDSIKDLRPMFGNFENSVSSNPESGLNFKNDISLNLNPSISNTPTQSAKSISTKESKHMSVFSQSKRTLSTKNSSKYSSSPGKDASTYGSFEYGQPLQILDIAEESKEEDKTPAEAIIEKLHELYEDLSFISNQHNTSLSNLTSLIINAINCFKKFIAFVNQFDLSSSENWHFTTYNNSYLRKIMKIYLDFYDNLLNDDVYIKLKLLLVKQFNEFASVLNSNSKQSFRLSDGLTKPQNFAIGINRGDALPNEELLSKIITKISRSNASIKEQDGSFIAPIVRGISKELNILCLYFGYPSPTDYHVKLTKNLQSMYEDIHIILKKNQIELASMDGHVPVQQLKGTSSIHSENGMQKFKLPFRIPSDIERPPISVSMSVENSTKTSGTLGGYIYPIIDQEKQPHLSSYSNSKFAISCGHVCLDAKDSYMDYPNVSAPSSVLVSLYKQALAVQYKRVSANNSTFIETEAKVAYGSVLNQLDEIFPLKKTKVIDPKSKEEKYVMRNLPVHRFGQIIWGERNLIDVKRLNNGIETVDKRLSDLAVIKINKNLKCDQNFLGDDIAFNEFDPGLMFDNLYVRAVIKLTRDTKALNLNIDEIDSSVSIDDHNSGLPVFKYGSTTKFTKGHLNGIKLVYWLDGAIHSSEFVINSLENNTAFAAGGDSGSWILTKLEDCSSVSESKGLGVVGMLHSYDGEFKQFGLYMPMCEILERLEEVTNIKWGVVGVSEKDNDRHKVDDTTSEEDCINSSEDSDSQSDFDNNNTSSESESESLSQSESESASEYESGVENLDGAIPPEID